MPMTAALVDIAVKRSFSIFDKLNIQANEMKPLFLKSFIHSNTALYLDELGVDLNLYCLRVVITTDRNNLSFYS